MRMKGSGLRKGASDLQVGCVKYWRTHAPLVVPLFHHGREGRPWSMFPPPPLSVVSGLLQPTSSWHLEKLGKFKKIFSGVCLWFPSLGEPQPRRREGGVGGRAETHQEKQSKAGREVGRPRGTPPASLAPDWPDPLTCQPLHSRQGPPQDCQAHPSPPGLRCYILRKSHPVHCSASSLGHPCQTHVHPGGGAACVCDLRKRRGHLRMGS